jgi:CRISPR/Cas system-associated endonuclease Cas3-HD
MSIWDFIKGLLESVVTTEPSSPITVRLEELSRIWLPVNGYRPLAPGELSTALVTEVEETQEPSENPAIEINKYKPAVFFESFWNQYIRPNIVLFEEGKLFPVVNELINILTEDGICPSIVVNDHIFSNRVAKDLAKITLQQHSLNVAEKLIEMMDNYLKGIEARDTVPTAIIAALGHDIGKISKYSSRYAKKQDHPYISAEIIVAIAEQYNAKSRRLDHAIEAIKMHHEGRVSGELANTNRYINWLQIADEKAREAEMGEMRRLPIAQDGAEWLDVEEMLKNLKPLINILETGGKQEDFSAFSYENTVYTRVDSLYDIAVVMYTKANNVVDVLFEYQHTRIIELARRQIVKRLYEAKKLSHTIDIEHWPYGKWYNITRSAYKSEYTQTKFRLVPIPIEHFGCLPSELEHEKEGWLKLITSVKDTSNK